MKIAEITLPGNVTVTGAQDYDGSRHVQVQSVLNQFSETRSSWTNFCEKENHLQYLEAEWMTLAQFSDFLSHIAEHNEKARKVQGVFIQEGAKHHPELVKEFLDSVKDDLVTTDWELPGAEVITEGVSEPAANLEMVATMTLHHWDTGNKDFIRKLLLDYSPLIDLNQIERKIGSRMKTEWTEVGELMVKAWTHLMKQHID